MPQEQIEKPKRKQKKEPRLFFEAGKLDDIKKDDLVLDMEAAKFTARKGQAGDRSKDN